MLSVYTTENIISTIYKDNENKYDVWYDFITKIRPSMNVLLDEGSDYDDNDYNPVYIFEKDFDIDIKPEYIKSDSTETYISQVVSMRPNEISNPCAIFILNVDKKTADLISQKYGVICHSFDENPADCPIFQEGIEKSVDKNETGRGWFELFDNQSVSPSNSLVFVDRYLFAKDSGGITSQDGLDNVFDILDKLLPKKLDVDYHVLFAFDASTINTTNGDSFEQISTQLNRLTLRLNRPYRIIVETVSIDKNDFNYDETHNRRILSNYYIIRVDRSLKAFRQKKSLYSQSLWLDWCASKGIVRQKRSDAPAKALYKYLKEVRDAINQLKNSSGSVAFTQSGDKRVEISNIKQRLMN